MVQGKATIGIRDRKKQDEGLEIKKNISISNFFFRPLLA